MLICVIYVERYGEAVTVIPLLPDSIVILLITRYITVQFIRYYVYVAIHLHSGTFGPRCCCCCYIPFSLFTILPFLLY